MSELKTSIIVAAGIATAMAVTSVYIILTKRQMKRMKLTGWSQKGSKEPSDKWERVGSVESLFIYPLKSCRRKQLTEGLATGFGLKELESNDGKISLADRQLLVYREGTGDIITARKYPVLLTVTVDADSDHLIFKSGDSRIRFQLPHQTENNKTTVNRSWNKELFPTHDCGPEAAKWISQLLLNEDSGFRIGFWGTGNCTRRKIREAFEPFFQIFPNMNEEYTGVYSDVGAFLLINKSSVEDLQSKMEKENDFTVTVNNFRPNIVIEGADAFAEDKWQWIKIGEETVFRVFLPCSRCVMTTIDPETQQRSTKYDPLKTMKKYRMLDNEEEVKVVDSPIMGVLIGSSRPGKIKIGDAVFVQ